MIDLKSELLSIVTDARNLNGAMDDATQDLRMAIEADAKARRAAKEMRQAYDDAEAEVSAEVLFNSTGKNKEARDAELDAALVKARRNGVLARTWALKLAADSQAEDAAMALKQAETQFSGVKHASDLIGNILRVVGS
jgi:hypothetical protein